MNPQEPEATPPAADPYAPVDYPAADYPTHYQGPPGYPPGYPGLPPPVYPAPYPPQYGYDPYRPPVPTGTNGKAIAALVLGVIGLPACMCFLPSLIGLVLGFVAMGETKRNGQAGHGIALAGVIVSGATLIMGIGFMAVSMAGG